MFLKLCILPMLNCHVCMKKIVDRVVTHHCRCGSIKITPVIHLVSRLNQFGWPNLTGHQFHLLGYARIDSLTRCIPELKLTLLFVNVVERINLLAFIDCMYSKNLSSPRTLGDLFFVHRSITFTIRYACSRA